MNSNSQVMEDCKEGTPEKAITIGIATTAQEKKEIYRFRYNIYVEEMSRQLVSIDYNEKLIYDDIDEWCITLYAKSGTKIIGTMRVNIGLLTDFPPDLVQVFSLDKFDKFYEGNNKQYFAFSSKLMVAPPYRNSQISYLLMAKGYELHCNYQVQFSFGGCNFHLLRFYEQFGGRRFGKNFVYPGYGLLTPVVLLEEDIKHMRAVRSPYYRIARKRKKHNDRVADWFSNEFPESTKVINSQLITEEKMWAILCAWLGNSPNKVISVLHGLSDEDTKKFLHECGIVARCHAGDRITTSGDPSNELNILLAGEVQTSSLTGPGTNRIPPGQHFGAIGLVDHVSHTQDAVSTTTSEILVLSRLAFPRFRHRYPSIANHVLENISHVETRRAK